MFVYRSLAISRAPTMAKSIPPTVQPKLPANVCYQSGSVARPPRFFVVNLHPNSLRECQAAWMTKSRGSRTGHVSREGAGSG
jgi:hypothetical protein